MIYTPEYITYLDEDGIFVFGSNLQGWNGSGSAKTAADYFGAEYGVGEGLTGRSYAFPTVTYPGKKHRLSYDQLMKKMETFLHCVEENSKKVFWLTKIGTNRAGIPIEEMQRLFWTYYSKEKYKNLIYPLEFEI